MVIFRGADAPSPGFWSSCTTSWLQLHILSSNLHFLFSSWLVRYLWAVSSLAHALFGPRCLRSAALEASDVSDLLALMLIRRCAQCIWTVQAWDRVHPPGRSQNMRSMKEHVSYLIQCVNLNRHCFLFDNREAAPVFVAVSDAAGVCWLAEQADSLASTNAG